MLVVADRKHLRELLTLMAMVGRTERAAVTFVRSSVLWQDAFLRLLQHKWIVQDIDLRLSAWLALLRRDGCVVCDRRHFPIEAIGRTVHAPCLLLAFLLEVFKHRQIDFNRLKHFNFLLDPFSCLYFRQVG